MCTSDYRLFGIVRTRLNKYNRDQLIEVFDEMTEEDCNNIKHMLEVYEIDRKSIKKALRFSDFKVIGAFLMDGMAGVKSFREVQARYRAFMTKSDSELTETYYRKFSLNEAFSQMPLFGDPV